MNYVVLFAALLFVVVLWTERRYRLVPPWSGDRVSDKWLAEHGIRVRQHGGDR